MPPPDKSDQTNGNYWPINITRHLSLDCSPNPLLPHNHLSLRQPVLDTLPFFSHSCLFTGGSGTDSGARSPLIRLRAISRLPFCICTLANFWFLRDIGWRDWLIRTKMRGNQFEKIMTAPWIFSFSSTEMKCAAQVLEVCEAKVLELGSQYLSLNWSGLV